MSFLVSLLLFPNEMFLYLVLFGGISGVVIETEQRNCLILQNRSHNCSAAVTAGAKSWSFV